jgi:hypothetical protein
MLVAKAVPVSVILDRVETDFGGMLTAGMGVSVARVAGIAILERVSFAGRSGSGIGRSTSVFDSVAGGTVLTAAISLGSGCGRHRLGSIRK